MKRLVVAARIPIMALFCVIAGGVSDKPFPQGIINRAIGRFALTAGDIVSDFTVKVEKHLFLRHGFHEGRIDVGDGPAQRLEGGAWRNCNHRFVCNSAKRFNQDYRTLVQDGTHAAIIGRCPPRVNDIYMDDGWFPARRLLFEIDRRDYYPRAFGQLLLGSNGRDLLALNLKLRSHRQPLQPSERGEDDGNGKGAGCHQDLGDSQPMLYEAAFKGSGISHQLSSSNSRWQRTPKIAERADVSPI